MDFGATSDRASFLQAIRALDPCGDGAGFWHATLVCGTERLSKLIEVHFPLRSERDGKLNPDFIAALEQIFAESGVPGRTRLCCRLSPPVRARQPRTKKETGQPPLKDMYDEWLARVICYAFSAPASPFVSQVNRATSETMRLQATQEGLIPRKTG